MEIVRNFIANPFIARYAKKPMGVLRLRSAALANSLPGHSFAARRRFQ